jgi:hypothetical protein
MSDENCLYKYSMKRVLRMLRNVITYDVCVNRTVVDSCYYINSLTRTCFRVVNGQVYEPNYRPVIDITLNNMYNSQ